MMLLTDRRKSEDRKFPLRKWPRFGRLTEGSLTFGSLCQHQEMLIPLSVRLVDGWVLLHSSARQLRSFTCIVNEICESLGAICSVKKLTRQTTNAAIPTAFVDHQKRTPRLSPFQRQPSQCPSPAACEFEEIWRMPTLIPACICSTLRHPRRSGNNLLLHGAVPQSAHVPPPKSPVPVRLAHSICAMLHVVLAKTTGWTASCLASAPCRPFCFHANSGSDPLVTGLEALGIRHIPATSVGSGASGG